jgi:hypothetical protein
VPDYGTLKKQAVMNLYGLATILYGHACTRRLIKFMIKAKKEEEEEEEKKRKKEGKTFLRFESNKIRQTYVIQLRAAK